MPRMPLHLASGTGRFALKAPKSIRLLKYGCTNRPFYHIVVIGTKVAPKAGPPIEQLGSYDCCYNAHNEKLVAFNFERIQYWIGHGAEVSRPLRKIFGLAGLFPMHPRTYMEAWRKRALLEEEAKKQAEKDTPAKENVAQ